MKTSHRLASAPLAAPVAVALALTLTTSNMATAAPAPAATPAATKSADPYRAALSNPQEDGYYPAVGEPDIDALHYGLDLRWRRATRTLIGQATIDFRAARTADQFQLDLSRRLKVSTVLLDSQPVTFSQVGKDLVIQQPIAVDDRHRLVVTYQGRPGPVKAPTTRTDFSTSGLTVTKRGELWTMQEPYGAYTWYPVNDHPSDKAFYDFTLRVPKGWTGIANGRLLQRRPGFTRFRLDSPAASYLTTLAVGPYRKVVTRTRRGMPVVGWYRPGKRHQRQAMSYLAKAVNWLEAKLGRYPFSSAGAVVVPSESAMETQTMVTFGNTIYTLSREVIVHEFAHQWFGDTVTPTQWQEVWLNEGITMYTQFVFEAEQLARVQKRRPADVLDEIMKNVRSMDQSLRNDYGPPGRWNKANFGESNVYYCVALMWHQLAKQLGQKRFWAMQSKWARTHRDGNATRADLIAFVERETGRDLKRFFNTWLDAKRTPKAS